MNLDTEKIIIQPEFINNEETDTFYVYNSKHKLLGRFNNHQESYKSIVIEADSPYEIIVKKDSVSGGVNYFFVDRGLNKLRLKGGAPIDSVKVTLSQSNREKQQLDQVKRAASLALFYRDKLSSTYREVIKNKSISQSIRDSLKQEIENLEDRAVLMAAILKKYISFFKNKPNSFLAPYDLRFWVTKPQAIPFMAQINSIYKNLSPEVKQTKYAQELGVRLAAFYKSDVGSITPYFTLNDINAQLIKIEKFEGQYVLLDFWASWCVPCIKTLPYLSELKSHHENKLSIILLSEDKNLKAWKEAIKKYDLNGFINISLTQNPHNQVKADYFVQGIPVKVLIDPEGKIIGRWEGYNLTFHKEIDRILSN